MHEYHLPLCTIMLLELVVPGAQPSENPAALKKALHEMLAKALRGVPENTRMAVESAAAAIVCFVGDPEEALHSALLLRDLVAQRYGTLMTVRIALNLGAVHVTADANDQVRVSGPGILQASGVKDSAQPDEVAVSRSFHELLIRLDSETADLFQYHGSSQERAVERYSVIPAATAAMRDPVTSFIVTRPVPLYPASLMDADAVQDIESELAGFIGPLAHVLVRKTEHQAADPAELREMLSGAIQDPAMRESFRAGRLAQPAGPAGSAAEPAAHAPSQAASASRVLPRADATRQVDIAPSELAIIAHTLQRFIGPMAQPLMRREMDFCVRFQDFVGAIASSIGHPQQRQVFLQALQRALPERRI